MGVWVVELFSKARLDVFVIALPKLPNRDIELGVWVILAFGVMWGRIHVLGIMVVSRGLLFTSLVGELRHVEFICAGLQGGRLKTGLGSWT
jgi:hypothetical protein